MTAVAPKVSDTLTLFQPGWVGADSAQHWRGAPKFSLPLRPCLYLNKVNISIFSNLEETPKHVVPGEVNTTSPGLGTDGSANNTNSKKVIVNGNATATTAAQVANDTNSERIKYVYVREHEHMHHGHSHAHSHIHSAPDSISSVAYMVRNSQIFIFWKKKTLNDKKLEMNVLISRENLQLLKIAPK